MSSSQDLFAFEEEIESDSVIDATHIFEDINKELEEYLLEKNIDADSTDCIFDFLESLANRVQEDFDSLIGDDTDKMLYQSTEAYPEDLARTKVTPKRLECSLPL